MLSKLLSLVRQALGKLSSALGRNRSQEAKTDTWLERLSGLQWVHDESDRDMPPDEKNKTLLEEMFGTTSPVNDGTIAANVLDWQTGHSQDPEPRKKNSGRGALLV
ncbi:MAG: hypothetical protein QOH93_3558 [Chloroflexia bacterium]|nr:hypothetical protein [Chloroflexia bacterium]